MGKERHSRETQILPEPIASAVDATYDAASLVWGNCQACQLVTRKPGTCFTDKSGFNVKAFVDRERLIKIFLENPRVADSTLIIEAELSRPDLLSFAGGHRINRQDRLFVSRNGGRFLVDINGGKCLFQTKTFRRTETGWALDCIDAVSWTPQGYETRHLVRDSTYGYEEYHILNRLGQSESGARFYQDKYVISLRERHVDDLEERIIGQLKQVKAGFLEHVGEGAKFYPQAHAQRVVDMVVDACRWSERLKYF